MYNDNMYPKRRLLVTSVKLLILAAPLCLGFGAIAPAMESPAVQDGAALYQKYCAQCHDSNAPRIPTRASLRLLSRTQIERTLESGAMKSQAAERTPQERAA